MSQPLLFDLNVDPNEKNIFGNPDHQTTFELLTERSDYWASYVMSPESPGNYTKIFVKINSLQP
jgi:hypothetical protein